MKTINKLTISNKTYNDPSDGFNSSVVYVDGGYLGTYSLSDSNMLVDFAKEVGVNIKEVEILPILTQKEISANIDESDL